ncbi:MAG: phosphoribosylglycinamide formyltransferase [Desulfobacterales bacterium]|jgi:phosphoribosylglycinamide formyltransferase 1|nr:phosphoribosylglycinamide formyltransferase [Desulfobacterales bacterium]
MAKKIKIGALISGGGTNLQAIIDSCRSGEINGEIVFVGTDNPDAKGLQRAEEDRIPTFVTNYSGIIKKYNNDPEIIAAPDDFIYEDILTKQSFFPEGYNPEKIKKFLVTRAVAEDDLLKQMAPYQFDLIVLAGFMRNLTPYFIDRVNTDPLNPRIMNIHPALLPSFPGVDGYGDTFRYGCKTGGCTVHFIDYGEDSGPIIGQKSFQIEPEDTIDTIKKKGLELEWQLYPECVRLFAEGRLKTEKKTFTLDNGKTFERVFVTVV